MRKKGSLIFLKLCTLKVHVKLIFFNFENCDVTIFNYEKNRFLCRNFGNFGSKPQAMRGLFLGKFVFRIPLLNWPERIYKGFPSIGNFF